MLHPSIFVELESGSVLFYGLRVNLTGRDVERATATIRDQATLWGAGFLIGHDWQCFSWSLEMASPTEAREFFSALTDPNHTEQL